MTDEEKIAALAAGFFTGFLNAELRPAVAMAAFLNAAGMVAALFGLEHGFSEAAGRVDELLHEHAFVAVARMQ